MKWFGVPFLRRFRKDQRGQTLVMVALTAMTVMALSGATVDVAHVYYAYQLLVASTNAAALAGASAMPSTSQATTNADAYGSATVNGVVGKNANPWLLTNATIGTSYYCSSTVEGFNVACQTSTGASGGNNAITVTQTAKVPLWFGGLFGMPTMTISATASAGMRGGSNSPWNIAIILDTTHSMGDEDVDNQCTGTQLHCAELGLQALLGDLWPCAMGSTCTSTSPAPPAVDSVSLYVFPAVTAATAANDSTCPSSGSEDAPNSVAYTIPDTSPAYAGGMPTSNLMLPGGSTGDTYQVIPSTSGGAWSINYQTTDNGTLNTGSPLVIAAGDSGKSNCPGVQIPTGEHTYYAQVIYQAQSDLATQQKNNPGSQNAIIVLSDGNATSCSSNANTAAGACDDSDQILPSEGTLNGTGTATSNPTGYESPVYPSALGECGQAVVAAQYAASQGTAVYTIGYGALTSGGCASDAQFSASVSNHGVSWGKGGQPCTALDAMASSSAYFYSDDASGTDESCLAESPTNQNITKLTQIFHAIANNMSVPRLIPAGT